MPRADATSTLASNAASVVPQSPGYVATHRSEPPNSAISRVTPPSTALHPLPGTRLLQAETPSRKYGHRVRCRMLPPTVAAFLSCCDAAS